MATSNDMSLAQPYQDTLAAENLASDKDLAPPGEGKVVASLNQLKLRLSQLEMHLARLAVVFGLNYGCLQQLAPSFLRVKGLLLKLARQHERDSDLVDLAETLLTDASGHDLCDLEEQLLTMRRHAQDPGKQQFAPAYRVLMADLLKLEQDLQSALQKALGNLAG